MVDALSRSARQEPESVLTERLEQGIPSISGVVVAIRKTTIQIAADTQAVSQIGQPRKIRRLLQQVRLETWMAVPIDPDDRAIYQKPPFLRFQFNA